MADDAPAAKTARVASAGEAHPERYFLVQVAVAAM